MAEQSEEFRAQAEECRKLAALVSGRMKRQYEELARQWLGLAERLERHNATIDRMAA